MAVYNEYDHLDRMSKVVDNGHESVIYQYNDNRTIKKMITGGMIITEYTYDTDQNITGQKMYHYASDNLGSITDVMNYQGQVLNHYEYDASMNTYPPRTDEAKRQCQIVVDTLNNYKVKIANGG